MNVEGNIKKWLEKLPYGVELVAVSKFHPASLILEAYRAGQRLFGESRVQEFLEKQEILPKDIEWHFIGHLQTNKVKSIIGKTALIESVDSERLLDLINRESEKKGVLENVLLQIHVAAEETKFGFSEEELLDFFNSGRFRNFSNVKICGIMGMATNTDDENRIREDFRKISSVFQKIKESNYDSLPDFSKLSMGMSGDWEIAVAEGANIIRIGSAIFGDRQY